MTALYIALKIGALLLVIVGPLFAPASKKKEEPLGLSDIAVNEDGYLEYVTSDSGDNHPVH